MPKLRAQSVKPVLVRSPRPNAGVAAAYHKRLDCEVEQMHSSLLYWLGAEYKRQEPKLATDANPSDVMRRAFGRIARRWQARFDVMAATLGPKVGNAMVQHADRSFMASLKQSGWTIPFKMDTATKTVLGSVTSQNVGLIKSIAQEHLQAVNGAVQRSISMGGDLGTLSRELEHQYGVTKRRAAFIARDQNSKATAAITKVRQEQLGIKEAIWRHSSAGKHPRPSHVAASGKRYDVSKGMEIDQKFIFPGQEPNCRCYSVSIVPGFND